MHVSHIFVASALFFGLASCFPKFGAVSEIVDNAPNSTLPWFRRRQAVEEDEKEEPSNSAGYKKISVSGSHKWKAPGPNDKRGPCPALNALANHGYFPRNGVISMLSAPAIVSDVFGMSIDLGLVLSVYTTIVAGDIFTFSWSIGGPSGLNLLGPILGGGKGLSGSHNKFETDASVTHGDYYLFNKDVDSVQLLKLKHLLSLQDGEPDPNFTLEVMHKHRNYSLSNSILTNPEFFYGPLSGLLVSNAGHTFIPAMFSNFSAQHPNGHLSEETLLTFLAVYKDPNTGILTHKKGYERIPENWYRRPSGILSEYGTAQFAIDLIKMAEKNPQILKIGGNTGTVNSFAGVDLGDLTGGVYNIVDLLNPEKLVCFVFRLLLAVVPDLLQGGLLGGILNIALNLLTATLVPLFDPKCPGIQQWNGDMLAQFPGAGAKAV